MVDGIQKGQLFLITVEVNVTGREYQSEDAQCGERKGIALLRDKKGSDRRLFLKSYLNHLVDWGSWKGGTFLTDLAYGLLSI